MFIKKVKGEEKVKRWGDKYVYAPEYISARRTKRIELTTISLCVFLLFSNIYLKSNYGGEYIEYVLEKRFDDEFEFINIGGSESWMSNYTTYNFESQKVPEQEISVLVREQRVFWDFTKWSSDYISTKYKSQAEAELEALFEPIYGDCTVIVENGFETNIKNLSFDEFMHSALDGPITIITQNSLNTKDVDVESVAEVLKQNGITVTFGFRIWYTPEDLDISNLKEYQIYDKSILTGRILLDEGSIESVSWSN